MKTCSHCGCIYDDNEKRCPSCKSSRIKVDNNKSINSEDTFTVKLDCKNKFLDKLNSASKGSQITFYIFYSLSLITFCTHHWFWFIFSFLIFLIMFLSIKFEDRELYLTSNLFLTYSDKYFTEDWDSIERQRKALTEYYEILEEKPNNAFVLKTESDNTYETSLNSCSCMDFQKRHQPCKHMYFVAHKNNVFNLLWGFKNSSENKTLVDLLSRNSLSDNSLVIPNNDLKDLKRFGVVSFTKITPKLMNLEVNMLISAFPTIIEQLNSKGANVTEETGKKKFLNELTEKLPEFVEHLKSNYVILNVDYEHPKYKSYRIRQHEFTNNKYSKNYLTENYNQE